MIITLFGKSIKFGKNPNQIDMFATAGAEKEFAPGDKRRLELTSGGKLRWKNADEEGSGKLKVESGKNATPNNQNIREEKGLFKEAYEQTQDEYAQKMFRGPIAEVKKFKDPNDLEDIAISNEQHKVIIKHAIREGKEIPDAVIEPYKNSHWAKEYLSKKVDYSQELINTAQTSKTFDKFLTNVRIHVFPNEFLKKELGLGDDNVQNRKKLNDYYNRQKAEHREQRKKDKEEGDKAIAELHVDQIEKLALQQYGGKVGKEKKIDDDKIAELYRNSPISIQVDKMSNKAQEIYNNAGNQAEKQIAFDLWNYGNGIQDEFVEKYVKGEKISTEDVMEVKRIANILIKGADEEFEKVKNGSKAKITIKKKKEEPVKKEPWERTLSDMIQNEITNREIFGPESYPKWITDNTKVEIADRRTGIVYDHFTLASPTQERLKHYGKLAHYEIIKRALVDGKPVPPEVLRDYPELEKETSLISELPFTASLKKDLESYGEKTKNILVEGTYQPFADWFKKQYPDQEFKIGKHQDGGPFIAITGGGEIRYSAYQKDNSENEIKLSKLKKRKEVLGEKLYSEKLKNHKKVSNIGFGTNMRGYQKTKQLSFRREDELQQKIKEINEEIKDLLPKNVSESNKSIFKNLFKAFGKQISMFGAQPYQKEGQTKEGRGGTLKLTRDSSGKGAHWKLVGKGQSAVDGQQSAVGSGQEKQTGGKIITPANAFELLQDKIGNSVLLQDNEGNLLGEGALQLVNENSEGNYSLFLKEANGFDSLVSIPKNQAVVQKEDGISFKFADKNILISTIEKSKIPNKPVEMEKAEENAKHARNLEKMRNFNEWQKKADSYARTANGQKDWFFGDMEIAADAEGLEFGVKNRIIKKADTLFKEIKRNATRDDKAEIYSALIGAFEVKSVAKAKAVISNLKKKGYEIDADQLDQPKDKENFFTRIKISKGENDPLPKELQFATGEYALAFEECAKKPNPLRETEMSLGLKINAEGVPEFNTIKKQLFNLAGEGLGQLWVTGGLPGSGKSSTLGGEFYKNKVLIDPDKIKYMLAEERGISQEEVNKKPWELHEESSNIAKHLVREAIREKKDVIYDVTMKGTENLNDLLYMVNSDTFQANAEFIHLPIEKGIERDKARGESGGRSIGADLYKKLFGGYPTHKAFFELKDSFDNFRVYDNSAPLGEGAKLFYVKNDGQEKILHPGIHDEFKKFGLKQMGKSLYLRYQRRKLVKAIEPTPKTNETQLPESEKLKLLLGFKEQGIDRDIDPEQDFFALGMLKMHGLIDENMNLTPEGEQKYQFQFGSKFSNMNGEESDVEQVVNPRKNIAEENKEKKPAIKAFGKEFNKKKPE